MNEQYYAPLPDVNAYLKRIGMEPVKEATLENLDAIVYAHQTHIPFEDLSPYYLKENVELGTEDLFNKMVVNKRGGFCFEMNALLYNAIIALGYDAYPVACRIVRGLGREAHPSILHRGTIVNIEGEQYFCDVGFGGPMPAGALPLGPADGRIIRDERFLVERFDDNWLTVSRYTSKGEKEEVLDFINMPFENVDFIAPCYYCSTSPYSLFTKLLLVNMRTETGSKNITGDKFTVVENGETTVTDIKDIATLMSILKTEFDIEIPYKA